MLIPRRQVLCYTGSTFYAEGVRKRAAGVEARDGRDGVAVVMSTSPSVGSTLLLLVLVNLLLLSFAEGA